MPSHRTDIDARDDHLVDRLPDPRTRPRCECHHQGGACRRSAQHRVSLLCRERDCARAVHVSLACTPCKDEWLAHAAIHPGMRLRVKDLAAN